MDKKIEKLHRAAKTTFLDACVFAIIFALISLICERGSVSNLLAMLYLVSFFGMVCFVIVTSICWLKYYQKRDKGIKTTVKPKFIVGYIVVSILLLFVFLFPISGYDGNVYDLLLILRIMASGAWIGVFAIWIIYCYMVKDTKSRTTENPSIDKIKHTLVDFAFNNFLKRDQDYTVNAEFELPGVILVKKVARWAYCHAANLKNIHAVFSIETDKGLYCFQVNGDKFIMVDSNICTSIYPQLLPKDERERQEKELQEKEYEDGWEKEFVSKEFQTYLQQFEHLAKTALELMPEKSDNHGFSKFGGLPTVPNNFVWPRCENVSLQFVAQLDFAEINSNNSLKDFPTAGLMYIFIKENSYERDDCKILFFEATDKLFVAKKPKDLAMVYKEIYLTTKLLKTYPNISDCTEAAKICNDNQQDCMNDIYERYTWRNMEKSFIGGWGSYIQNAYFLPEQEHPEDWMLLCQISSAEGCDDDGFMWGDAGALYLFIRKDDLQNHKYSHVKLDMQCG